MAAVSAPPASLTPPSSSHGVASSSWNYSVPAQTENNKTNDYSNRPPLSTLNGHTLSHQNSRPELSQRKMDGRPADSTFLAPARVNNLARKESNISETGSAPDSLLDLYGTNGTDSGTKKMEGAYGDEDAEHSRWIHRDKLAKIESEELQAAGIILPRPRATSKSSRREHSRDQHGSGMRSEQAGQKRQRIGSSPTEEIEPSGGGWDLRLPEEVASDPGDFYRDMSGGVKGISRIPVSKMSPIPIPLQHLERDTPIKRTQNGTLSGGDDEPLSIPKSRGRSGSIKLLDDLSTTPTTASRLVSDSSPTKKTPAARKASTPGTGPRTPSAQRPKTRSGQPREVSGTQRPTTRSGELNYSGSVSKRPEGDPPWLATMYKPDPRLPPDQQLLPTVAKRLQQEQWEKEGKFGNTYDTSFRPLNDEQIRPPPEPVEPPVSQPQTLVIPEQNSEPDAEWPLKGPKSPALSTGRPGTAGGYSTIPKIQQGLERIPSPRVAPPTRVPEPPEEQKKDGGCGCCVVM